MSRNRRYCLMLGLGVAATLAVTSLVLAQGFPQATSASTLSRADGSLWDTTLDDDPPHWTFDGSFLLRCQGGACGDVPLGSVFFDIGLTMVRPDGDSSHTHTFSDFVATAVTVDGVTDTLTIDGTIVGTGAFGGINDVTFSIVDVAAGSLFTIEFPGNAHIVGTLSGLALRSR